MRAIEERTGFTFPPTAPYPVTAGKIREFAAALGDANPRYAGEDAVAPPTFAAVLAADAWDGLFTDPELDLQLKRTIHYDQKFAYARPLRAGDVVTSTLTIEKVRVRGNTAFITVSVALATVAGEHLCTATSTLLHTWEDES
ncbi:MAG TPA: MaoC family dehydratase N-terminal domain-containing protein [Propioniciclava tarda]|nr:MaoC family dehydratase N-terminal domain-containing protein [Propioniciclava tarda]HQD61755.1 MaoC family dehydratase N-terminal domain-containing protein [Propioniciclava tarda]